MKNTLDSMKIGNKTKVIQIDDDLEIKRRLLEIGISPGVLLECVLMNPFKNLIAYRVKNTMIALRREDTKKIFVGEIYG